MSKKRNEFVPNKDLPEVIESPTFYGYTLDKDQSAFRDAIWNRDNLIVFCNAAAGSGKTLIATGVANMLFRHKAYEGIDYIVSPYGTEAQGFLPGDLTAKSEVYYTPFYQAMMTCGMNPNTDITDSIESMKNGTAYITLSTHTFLRGTTYQNRVVIIDEAQNFTTDDLKKTLTRCADSCKVIVIGHDKQCDLVNKDSSGFVRYLNHFKDEPYCEVCELTKNYRGVVSAHADAL